MFQRVCSVQNPGEADLIISMLRAAGLHPLDLETSPHVSLAGADLTYDIEVPEEEADPAREIMIGMANQT